MQGYDGAIQAWMLVSDTFNCVCSVIVTFYFFSQKQSTKDALYTMKIWFLKNGVEGLHIRVLKFPLSTPQRIHTYDQNLT